MAKVLRGKVFPSGTIEFSFALNPWAQQWMETMRMKNKSSSRIFVRPANVEIQIELAPGLNATEFNWLHHTHQVLMISDSVFLKPIENSFRFQIAELDLGKGRTLLTVGSTDIASYAKKNWNRIKYFYAHRYEGFYFDFKKLVTGREGKPAPNSLELFARLRAEQNSPGCHLSFVATGSNVCNDIITWRSTVEKGESGRFSVDDAEVRIEVSGAKRPLTFLRQYRTEFHNLSFEFEGDLVKAVLAKRLPTQPATGKRKNK